MGTHYFELGIEVQRKVKESSPSGRRVPRRHGLERIVNLFLIARTYRTVVHQVSKTDTRRGRICRDIWLADRIEMRAQASNEPFNEDLKDSSSNQACIKYLHEHH